MSNIAPTLSAGTALTGNGARAGGATPPAAAVEPAPERPSRLGTAWRGDLPLGGAALLALVAGALALALPTMILVAQVSWSSEQGAHGPIVLATGLWLLARLWPSARAAVAPPPGWRVAALLAVLLPAYMLFRVTETMEVEGFVMHAALIAGFYGVVGGEVIRRLWFPLFYLAFMFPPPDTLVYAITLPMKIGVSEVAVGLLSALGYPIGGTGVSIQIGQYQLLVAAACSGLNSIISLSALSTFYIYIRHQAEWRYALLLILLVVPVALLANLVRVLILILLTYHGGEAVAQGFMHNFAGLTMFAVALLAMFGLDKLIEPVWRRWRSGRPTSHGAAVAA